MIPCFQVKLISGRTGVNQPKAVVQMVKDIRNILLINFDFVTYE